MLPINTRDRPPIYNTINNSGSVTTNSTHSLFKYIFCKYKQIRLFVFFISTSTWVFWLDWINDLIRQEMFSNLSLRSLALSLVFHCSTVVKQVTELVPQQTNFLSFPGFHYRLILIQSVCTCLPSYGCRSHRGPLAVSTTSSSLGAAFRYIRGRTLPNQTKDAIG